MLHSCYRLLLCLALSMPAFTQVTHLVDVQGPAGSFDTIQEAIDAAQDGDTVFIANPLLTAVSPDATAGFVIDGKGLTVASRTGRSFTIWSSRVENVPNGSAVVLQGLGINGGHNNAYPLELGCGYGGLDPSSPGTSLMIRNCSGVVSLDLCCVASRYGPAVVVEDSELVTLRRVSTLGGTLSAPQSSFSGIEIVRSRVDAEECQFNGGVGQAGDCDSGFTCNSCDPGGNGGDGAVIDQGGYLFASSCEFQGGEPYICGACWPCVGHPGTDIRLESGGVMIERNSDSIYHFGLIQTLTDTPRELKAPTSVGPSGRMELTASGAPNEVVYFLMSERGGLFGQGVDGRALMVGSPLPGGRRRLGTIGPDGSLTFELQIAPALVSGTRTRHVQLAFVSPTGTRLSNAAAVVQVGTDQPFLAETEAVRVVPGTAAPGVGRDWNAPHGNLDDAATYSLAHPGAGLTYWILEGDFRAIDLTEASATGYFNAFANSSFLGGFTGTEQAPDERDLTQHRTRISGDVLGDDAPSFQNRSDNLRHWITSWITNGTPGHMTTVEGIDHSGFGVSLTEDLDVFWLNGPLSIRSCRFIDNLTGRASLFKCASAELERTEWIGNRGQLVECDGWAEHCVVAESLIVGNTAPFSLMRAGGRTNIRIEGVTAVGNRVDHPAGAVFLQANGFNAEPMRIRNAVFTSNAAGGSQLESAHFSPHPSVVDPPDLGWSLIGGWSNGYPAPGVIDLDPSFVDVVGFDGIPYTADGDYRLRLTSACVDAGDNDAVVTSGVMLDLDERTRRVDQPGVADTGNGVAPVVDLGCYER